MGDLHAWKAYKIKLLNLILEMHHYLESDSTFCKILLLSVTENDPSL